MTTQSLIKEIKNDKYSRPIIQALVSQSNLATTQYIANMQDPSKHSDLNRQLASIVGEWYRIKPTFDYEFPENFIESAIYSSCGDVIKNTFHDLGLKINLRLASDLKKWLYE
jgi:hypothetical protein